MKTNIQNRHNNHARKSLYNNILLNLTLSIIATVLIFSGPSVKSEETPIWPMPDRTDFSSGYGDYRPGRFHYGLDLRTGNNRLPVVAPVDGYVSQVWVQYFGYGKALYFTGDDGRIYVFAHLARFAPEINQQVRTTQISKERYFIREWFERDRFRMNQGDTLAYSGKTGIGAPHMHFEVRNQNNVPQSPLRQGLQIKDKTGPVIKSLTFQYLDYESIFATGRRTKSLACNFIGLDGEGASRYNLSAFPYLTAPFGLTVSSADYPTNKKFDSSPRELRYRVGKSTLKDSSPNASLILYQTYFERLLDSLSYSEGALALDVYDQSRALKGDKNSYLLFQRHKSNTIAESPDSSDAVRPGRFPEFVSNSNEKLYGVYPARVDVTDASGNRSTLDYSFCYGPAGEFFTVTDIGSDFALLTTTKFKLLDKQLLFSELLIYEFNKKSGWIEAEKAVVTEVGKGAFRITIGERARNQKRVYRAVLKGRDGWYKPDVIFSNVPPPNKLKLKLGYELADAGLYVTATTSSPTTDQPIVQALSSDEQTQELPMMQIGANTFSSYLAYNKTQKTIESLRSFLNERSTKAADEITDLQIGVPAIAVDTASSLIALENKPLERIVSNGTCYVPSVDSDFARLLECGAYEKRIQQGHAILGGPFYLGPKEIRYDRSVMLRMRADSAINPALNVAICKLSNKGDKWNWFTTEYDDEFFEAPFFAEIKSNGVFALMIDTVKPTIKRVVPAPGKTIASKLPRITAEIADDLSGIWEDTLFNIRLDGEWLIPEYDNEDNFLETRPNQPLESGEHTLIFQVRDNAGNQVQRKVTFYVQ